MRKLSGKLLIAAAAAAMGLALSAGAAEAAICTTDGYNVAASGLVNAGKTYDVLSGLANNESWTNAEACAGLLGGTLVSIDNSTQNTYVTGLLTTYSLPVVWIGIEGPNGQSGVDYYWVNGDPSTYENWAGGFPDNDGGNLGDTSYGYLGGSGTWANANNDTFPSEDIGAIVLVPTVTRAPEPASVAIFGAVLFGLGFSGFLRRRRKSA